MNQKDIDRFKFILTVLETFSIEKQTILKNLLEELNSSSDPQTRFFKSQLRRMAQFEAQFLEMMETYQYDTSTINPVDFVRKLVGLDDF
jgi:5-methylcytosine-specific restriction endonuclease McrBC regulatory subunit McrC